METNYIYIITAEFFCMLRRALENICHRSSLSCLSASAFLSCCSLHLSRCGMGERPGVAARRPRLGLSMSGPQLTRRPERPSTWRRNVTDGPVTSRPTWQGWHEWLPGGSGSLSQSCGRYLLATSHSRRHRPTAYKRR
jgi:hypothetical protein